MNEEGHVEFNTQDLLAALQSGIDINTLQTGDSIDRDLADYRDELIDEVDSIEASMNIASIGGNYKIGPIDFKCVLGNLVLLSSIDSPLLSDRLKTGDELSFDDCVQAIYVLAKGKDAVAPIMAISQRINDLMLLKPLVKGNPEMMDKIIAKAEEISKARIKFAEDAREFWTKEFVGYDFESVINEMISSITDVLKASRNLPDTNASSSTPNLKKK